MVGNRSANKSSDRMPTSPFTWSSSTSLAVIADLSWRRLLRFRWWGIGVCSATAIISCNLVYNARRRSRWFAPDASGRRGLLVHARGRVRHGQSGMNEVKVGKRLLYVQVIKMGERMKVGRCNWNVCAAKWSAMFSAQSKSTAEAFGNKALVWKRNTSSRARPRKWGFFSFAV